VEKQSNKMNRGSVVKNGHEKNESVANQPEARQIIAAV
jgi:hypothetical protein